MQQGLSAERRAEILEQFSSRSILVVGDLMVDEYLHGAARRISQEGPVMVIEVVSDELKPGGAANVANNLVGLGARVCIAGVVGDDEIGRLLCQELTNLRIDIDGIARDPTRPTTRKTRIVAQSQQVMRIDREQTQPIAIEVSRGLSEYVERTLPLVDALLISDYRKGAFTEALARTLCDLAKAAGKPLITNPKPASAPWLRGSMVLSLNQIEAEELAGTTLPNDDSALRAFGERLSETLDTDTLMVTRGARGLCLWLRGGEYYRIPAHLVEVADIAGAGDTTIGAMALALVSGASVVEAGELANLAGACVVRKHGVATLTRDELLNAI